MQGVLGLGESERLPSEGAVAVSRKFLVRINLEQLRSNLSKADGQDHTLAEVRKWLREAGFEPAGDAWLVDQANLGQLEPSEVEDAELGEVDDAELGERGGTESVRRRSS